MAIITIVGAGMMGSAIGIPASDNGHEVRLVGTPLDREIIDFARETGTHKTMRRALPGAYKYYQYEELALALSGADALVSGVSSFGVSWFLENILPILPEDLPILCVTKGMFDDENGNLIPYPIHYQKHCARKLSINAVGGPCTSYELADRDSTYVAFCGENAKTLRFLRDLFSTDYYNISLSTDIMGVECAVAMKNAYALAVTLAVGLAEKREGEGALHYNSQAALFAQSVREMQALLALTGGGAENIVYGAGDLYVTVFGGRTRKIGTLLGRGLSFDDAMASLKGITLESIVIARRTARAVRKKIAQGAVKAQDFPLLMHVDEIISAQKPVNIPWKAFEIDHL